jgi:uncharacterized protein (TIGR00661 family)
MKRQTICIAPLDWGLGHATRCISLTKGLLQLGYNIVIASEGHHQALLREAIPEATFLTLAGYRIKYSKKGKWFLWAILLQIPKIVFSIYYEKRWLYKMQKQFHFDIIISDNRFGFRHHKIPSVFITHQLNVQTPWRWSNLFIRKIQYHFINRFDACWVPDMEGNNNLSGILSNATVKPKVPIWYMGTLSRLKSQQKEASTTSPIQFLGIVSGPEPQRTLFENLLWATGNGLHKPFAIVAGRPLQLGENKFTQNGALYQHADGDKLALLIQSAEVIIFRGGYTSLMELLPFNKKLIMVPTPGQTEQTYLAKWWSSHHWALYYEQAHFNLEKALEEAEETVFEQPVFTPFSVETLKAKLKELTL